MNQILTTQDAERKQMTQILNSFTYADFKHSQGEWLKNGRMHWFCYGNLAAQTAVEMVERARATLNIKAVEKAELPSVRCVMLGKRSRIDFDVEDKKNENSTLVTYFQGGPEKNDFKAAMLNHITQ
jgi:secreted Zn-dependent insulinase-like peptidase